VEDVEVVVVVVEVVVVVVDVDVVVVVPPDVNPQVLSQLIMLLAMIEWPVGVGCPSA